MSLTITQRLAILHALPTTLNDESVLVFEDDGGGWHHDPAIESWVSFTILPGPRWLYNVQSLLSSVWNSATSKIDDERGQINQGTINLYICSTNKRTVQAYEAELAGLIERTRIGLSLDVEGVTTGPENAKPRPLGSYNDYRLKRRVYRTLVEVPILYKFTTTEGVELIKRISITQEMGWPLESVDALMLRDPAHFLSADMWLAELVESTLDASIVLASTPQITFTASMLLESV